jgi:hypothetical protein
MNENKNGIEESGKDEHKNEDMSKGSNRRVILVALLLLSAFSFTRFFEIRLKNTMMMVDMDMDGRKLSAEEQKAVQAFLKFKKIKSAALPIGIPDVYGKELDVTFDEVQESMNVMRVMGPTYGADDGKIILEGDELKRFIAIGKLIACEYCCGVKTLVDDEGKAACGCAHSIVMRGLAAYLIKNHSNEMTDDEILEEVNKWKKVFFPKQTLTASFEELKKSGDKDIEALLQEFPDFLPQMVGGC